MSAATTQSLVLSSPSSLSSSSTSLCLQRKHHRHYRRRQLVAVKASKSIGKSSFGERKDKSNDKGLLAVSTSLLVLSSQSAFFQAFAEEASSSSSGDVSPFAGVVDIADRAKGMGLEGIVADGTDVLAMYETTSVAVAKARRGETRQDKAGQYKARQRKAGQGTNSNGKECRKCEGTCFDV